MKFAGSLAVGWMVLGCLCLGSPAIAQPSRGACADVFDDSKLQLSFDLLNSSAPSEAISPHSLLQPFPLRDERDAVLRAELSRADAVWKYRAIFDREILDKGSHTRDLVRLRQALQAHLSFGGSARIWFAIVWEVVQAVERERGEVTAAAVFVALVDHISNDHISDDAEYPLPQALNEDFQYPVAQMPQFLGPFPTLLDNMRFLERGRHRYPRRPPTEADAAFVDYSIGRNTLSGTYRLMAQLMTYSRKKLEARLDLVFEERATARPHENFHRIVTKTIFPRMTQWMVEDRNAPGGFNYFVPTASYWTVYSEKFLKHRANHPSRGGLLLLHAPLENSADPVVWDVGLYVNEQRFMGGAVQLSRNGTSRLLLRLNLLCQLLDKHMERAKADYEISPRQ